MKAFFGPSSQYNIRGWSDTGTAKKCVPSSETHQNAYYLKSKEKKKREMVMIRLRFAWMS
jgi:hypothetical protein